jgi:hypothetical protein
MSAIRPAFPKKRISAVTTGADAKNFYAIIRAGAEGEFKADAFGASRLEALYFAMDSLNTTHPDHCKHHHTVWAYLFHTQPASITYSPYLKVFIHDALVLNQASCVELRLEVVRVANLPDAPRSLTAFSAWMEATGGAHTTSTALRIPDDAAAHLLSLDQADGLIEA